MRIRLSVLFATVAFCASSALPASLPSGFSEVAITGSHLLTDATAMEFSPDGKLFVLEQSGTLEVWQGSGTNWTLRRADFFANTPLNVNDFEERGLLGIAFDPNYTTNRFVYIYYTVGTGPVHNRISRFKANSAGDLAVAGSERTLMDLDHLSAGNHNGGAIHFGPDGKLYVAVGDNADGSNAQSLDNRLGKILRLNRNINSPIPNDNPSSIDGIGGNTTGDNRAIWCAGLRNPFTFTFKPGTSLMYINDVGLDTFEEINIGAAGANYGWSVTEGPFNQGAFPSFTEPLAYYHHNDQTQSFPLNGNFTGEAITGGAFYNPTNRTFPAGFLGDYFFADYIDGWIRRYDPNTVRVNHFASNVGGPVCLLVGNDGALYYLARDAQGQGAGSVLRVQRTPFFLRLGPILIPSPGGEGEANP